MPRKQAPQQATPQKHAVAIAGLRDWWISLNPEGGARILRQSEVADLRETIRVAYWAILTDGEATTP